MCVVFYKLQEDFFDRTYYPHGKQQYLHDKMMRIGNYPFYARRIAGHMVQNGIRMEDLDFTLPGDTHYNQSNRFSIFQNEDPVREGFLLSLAFLDPISFSDKFHYVFTVANKITTVGTEAPEILFIAWPLKEEVCHYINRDHGFAAYWAETHVLDRPPDLTPYYHGGELNQAVTEIKTEGQPVLCAQDKSGVRYYIHTIVER